ncbi:glycosyltransferase family 4 protein [Yeosuana sp. MJ-SS3]|uniref:Glycosyltransferase family 4 protein n=1 Tax=Gilvirhabdus luticola TaxID=3079858 RepID=A0ABU3U4Z3_9FLAO|nr:glycosyltransferase family 4 protein [Yeosuana sp. MJ-SS3]MDU8885475.1 glycosyltransferase family 4 protein [Yeosuana sp. MJ-SS3]
MGSFEKNIKICFVTREYAHPHMGKTGGIGVFLKQFTQELKQHHFDIVIFTFGANPLKFNDAGANIVRIRDLSRFNEWIKAPLRRHKVPGYITVKLILEFINRFYISMYLSVFVLKHKFDVIEFHDYGGDAPYFIGRITKIVRCHGSANTLHQFMGYGKRLTDFIFERHFFKRFHNHVIAVSKYSAETTKQAFQLKKMPKVIYSGIQVPSAKSKSRYIDLPTVPYTIFYFGSIRERKGIDIACRTFNAIVVKYPDATFHVLGNNNNDYWNTDAKHILSTQALQNTTYYGAIPNVEINNYLQNAHVVLFPSFGENFSIALLEVMALGKIVIVSDIPSFHEIIKHEENGFIAKNDDDYVKLVEKVFNQAVDINTISKQALKTIVANFERKQVIKQNINYYKSLVSFES